MRENDLLTPDGRRTGNGGVRRAPRLARSPEALWSTGAIRVYTVDEGWGWIFTAVEHQYGECIGWYVDKRGDRFAALKPVSMGLKKLCGSTGAGAARGLVLRIDSSSQYLSDDFIKQIAYWGIEPAYAFIEQPLSDDAFVGFDRMLKEEIIEGRTYRTVEELRDAFKTFVDWYNAWLLSEGDAGRNLPFRDDQRSGRRTQY
jgi:putative transposase